METEDAPRGPMTNLEKHELVRTTLLDLVERLPEGSPLPPERRLSADLGVARMTLRRVLDILVASGDLTRVPGRGTFVARRRFLNPSGEVSFGRELERAGMHAGSRTVEFGEQDAGARLGQRLRVAPAARIVRAVRLRLADDEPVALERIHLPAELVPGLTGADLEDASLYVLLAERYEITVHRSSRTVQATSVNEAEAQLLGVPAHSPAFYIQSTRFDRTGRVVEYLDAIYRGDRYRFSSEEPAIGSGPSLVDASRIDLEPISD